MNDSFLQRNRQQVLPSNDINADAIIVENIAFLAEFQQFLSGHFKETIDFLLRAVEVVDGEGIDRDVGYGQGKKELEELFRRASRAVASRSMHCCQADAGPQRTADIRRTPFKASNPFSWPRIAERPSLRAARRLPSMMNATCFGSGKSRRAWMSRRRSGPWKGFGIAVPTDGKARAGRLSRSMV